MPTSTQVDAILKDDYKEYTDNLNNAAFLLAQIETKKDTVQGRVARHAIHTGRSGAIGARREGVALPVADQQRHAVLPVPIRSQFGRIQLTVQLMRMAASDHGAFVNALDSEMNIDQDVMRDTNRQLYGTSNGVIATCGVTSASTTVVLAANTPLSIMRHLYIGRTVDIGTVANPISIAQGRTITAVAPTASPPTITISGAVVTTTAAAFVFNTNSGGASNNTGAQDDGQSECTGLQTIISPTAVLHTLDPATTPIWKSQSYLNGGVQRPVPETSIDMALLNCTAECGKTPDLLLSNAGVFVGGKAILTGYQRNIDTMEFKGGYQGIKWSTPGIAGVAGKDVGWKADFDCPPNLMYGINMDSLVCHQEGEGWAWMQEDGAILSRVTGFAAYEAVLVTMMELACKQRNANFVIGDLLEAS